MLACQEFCNLIWLAFACYPLHAPTRLQPSLVGPGSVAIHFSIWTGGVTQVFWTISSFILVLTGLNATCRKPYNTYFVLCTRFC